MAAIAGNGVGGSVLSGSVWTGGIVPGVGDTSTFSNGVTYTLASGQTWRVGDSASPTTHAIRTTGTGGTAVFNFDGAVEVLGNVLQGNAFWTGGAGASVLFDHASTELTWQISDANSQNKRFILNGTQGAPCLVSSQAGGANGRFTSGGFFNGGLVDATHTDFTRIGTASNDAMSLRIDTVNANAFVRFIDVRFFSCGRVMMPANVPANASITLQRVEFSGSLNNEAFRVNGNGGALGTGTRLIDNVSSDKSVIVFGHSFTVNEFVINNDSGAFGLTITNPASMTNIAGRTNQTSTNASICTITPTAAPTLNGFYMTSRGTGNSRGVQLTLSSLAADLTLSRFVGHQEYSSGQGDSDLLILQSGPASLRTVTIRDSLGLLNGAGTAYGCFIAPLGNFSTLNIVAEHNTFCGDAGPESGFNTGDAQSAAYNGGTPLYTSVKSNLAYAGSLARAALFSRYGNVVNQQDAANPSGVTHNWVESPASGTFLGGDADQYSWKSTGTSAFFTTTPAGPITNGDPQFVDRTRNHMTWDLSLGGAGTGAAAFDRLAKRCRRSNPGVNDTVANLLGYVFGGFAPQNAATVAAHDSANGGTIGAVAYQAPSSGDHIRQQIPHLRRPAAPVRIPVGRRR